MHRVKQEPRMIRLTRLQTARYASAAMAMLAGIVILGGCQSNHAQTEKSEAVCHIADEKFAAAATQPTPVAEAKPAAPVKAAATFGPAQKLPASDTVEVTKVLAHPEEYKDKYVRVSGTVSAVCPKRGCWVRIAPDAKAPAGSDVFVKFRDPPEGRLIPMDAVGHEATVEGTVKVGMMSEAMARHFKEDAGAPQDEIDKIVGPQKQIVIAGPAVAIEGIEKPQAGNE